MLHHNFAMHENRNILKLLREVSSVSKVSPGAITDDYISGVDLRGAGSMGRAELGAL